MHFLKKQYILFLLFSFIVLFSCSSKRNRSDKVNNENDTIEKMKDVVVVDSFQYYFDKLIHDPEFYNASFSIFITDSVNNNAIFSYDENRALVPASTLKILTCGAALNYLGGRRNFATKLQYTGKIENHTLIGNIIIKGGGDPALGSKFYKKTYHNFIKNWSQKIKELGIDSIKGSIIADASIFNHNHIPATWSWGEIGDYYSTPASGLSVFDNRFELTFYAGNKAITRPKLSAIEPDIKGFRYKNQTVVDPTTKKSVSVVGAPYSNFRYLQGSVPAKNRSYTVEASIPDPPILTAQLLYQQLLNDGIKISGKATSKRRIQVTNDTSVLFINQDAKTIYNQYSPSVKSLTIITLLHSNNLFAEHLLKFIGLKRFGTTNSEQSAQALTQLWESYGLDTRGLNIFDGSGISRYNSITAKQLVDALNFIKDSTIYGQHVYKSLAVSGKSGTLRNFCKDDECESKIIAKSGSMSRVRSYSGYIKTLSGKTYTFAFIINNYNCKSSYTKQKIEMFLKAVIKFPIKNATDKIFKQM